MRIEVTPESHTTSIEVEDAEIIEAYKRGGREAVIDLLVENADDAEGAFLWPTTPSDRDLRAMLEGSA